MPTVIAYGFDDRAKGAARLVSAQWPPGTDAIHGAVRVAVHGVRDHAALEGIARDTHSSLRGWHATP